MASDEFYKTRPDPSNYAPHDKAYVSKVPDANVLEVLREQIGQMSEMFGSMTDEDASFRYAEGKWSSSPGELHPQALTEPDVNLSIHPALIVQSQSVHLTASEQTDAVHDGLRCPANKSRVVCGA